MTPPSDDLTGLTATRLTGLLSKRNVSAREVVGAFLDRIAALDDSLGAFAHLDAEGLIREAAAADARFSKRLPTAELHGLPVGLKDVFDVAGAPTAGGSRLPPVIPDADSKLASRLKRAGAILAGKMTTSEFGCGSPFQTRQPRNPWDLRHVAGGSSAGSAIAVAARMLPLTVGGDTGGSVRIPASFCGIVGLRPTIGTMPVEGSIPLAPGIDTAGPMARSADDAALLLRATGTGLDPGRLRRVSSLTSFELMSRDGVDAEVAATVEAVVRSAAEALRLEVRVVHSASLPLAWAGAWTMIYSRALRVHRHLLRDHIFRLSRPFRWKLLAAAALGSGDLRAGERIVAAVRDELAGFTDGDTVLVTPTTSHPANAIVSTYGGKDTMEWTASASLAGFPALSMPAGLTKRGLPIGVQIVGAPRTDLGLLQFAAILEEYGLVGRIGSPLAQVKAAAGVHGSLAPVEAPPATSISYGDVEEVRAAARVLGLPELEEADVDGAARSLRVVREQLHRRRTAVGG